MQLSFRRVTLLVLNVVICVLWGNLTVIAQEEPWDDPWYNEVMDPWLPEFGTGEPPTIEDILEDIAQDVGELVLNDILDDPEEFIMNLDDIPVVGIFIFPEIGIELIESMEELAEIVEDLYEDDPELTLGAGIGIAVGTVILAEDFISDELNPALEDLGLPPITSIPGPPIEVNENTTITPVYNIPEDDPNSVDLEVIYTY